MLMLNASQNEKVPGPQKKFYRLAIAQHILWSPHKSCYNSTTDSHSVTSDAQWPEQSLATKKKPHILPHIGRMCGCQKNMLAKRHITMNTEDTGRLHDHCHGPNQVVRTGASIHDSQPQQWRWITASKGLWEPKNSIPVRFWVTIPLS